MDEWGWDPRPYIARVRWDFSSTMPFWPHYYTVLHRAPEERENFLRFSRLIKDRGQRKGWPWDRPRWHNHYLVVDDFEYWPIFPVINRARLVDREPPLQISMEELWRPRIVS